MNKLLLLAFLVTPAFGQGWTQLTNTTMQNVCPPDSFTASFSTGGTTYNFPTGGLMYSQCYRVVNDWGSAVVDTKRNRLLLMGEGHDGYFDNAVYSVDLQTVSPSTATCGGHGPCLQTTNGGHAPAVTRLNDPSVPQFINGVDCGSGQATVNPDGTPPAMHMWNGMVYLPHTDGLFNYGNATVCDTPGVTTPFILSLSTMTWSRKAGNGFAGTAGRSCVLDSTVPDDEVICFLGNNYLYRYLVNSDSWVAMTNPPSTLNIAATPVLDPNRKVIYFFGAQYDGTNPQMFAHSLIDNSNTDLTSTVHGCGNLIAYQYPAAVYDPSINRIVAYVPQTVSSGPTAANTIVIFDPATMTCTEQPQPVSSGPSTASAARCPSGTNTCQGISGKFNYVPGLGEYVWLQDVSQNAYTFKLNATAVNGIGGSTQTCVDRDGDGYGVGPGCIGIDADDQDASVQTTAQMCNKWNNTTCASPPTNAQTLVMLKHLGYNPANIWYISTTGTTGGAVNNPSAPFAGCCGGTGNVQPVPGDAVVFRGGTYNNYLASPASGTAGQPIVYMSLPGEEAIFTTPSGGSAAAWDLNEGQAYVVLDGFQISNSGASNACFRGAEATNIVMRHNNANSCGYWGFSFQGDLAGGVGCPVGGGCRPLSDITLEDSIAYNMALQHGTYFTSHSLALSSNIFWHRNIMSNNPWNGFHLTGPFTNVVADQNLTVGNGLASISWQSGTSNSRILNHVSVNDLEGVDFDVYNGDGTICDTRPVPYGNVCPASEDNNLVQNVTVYLSGLTQGGTTAAQSYAYLIGAQSGCASASCLGATMSNNQFINDIALVNNSGGPDVGWGYGAFHFIDNTSGTNYLSHTSFSNIMAFNIARPSAGGVADHNLGTPFGYNILNCAGLTAAAASVSNCYNANADFKATCTWNTLGSCDLTLANASPAIGAGTAVPLPSYDLVGTPLSPTAPSLGGLQPTGLGWNELLNTTLAAGNGTSVCLPNHWGNGLTDAFTGHVWPDVAWYDGSGYGPISGLDNGCATHLFKYDSGVVDAANNRFLNFGGGHDGLGDNTFQSLDLSTISHSDATCGGQPCNVSSNQSGSPVNPSALVAGTAIPSGSGSITRLDDPSYLATGCTSGCLAGNYLGYSAPEAFNPDGSSASLQSYQGLVDLPQHNMIFLMGQADMHALANVNGGPYLVDKTKLGFVGAGNPWHWPVDIGNSAGDNAVNCTNYPNLTTGTNDPNDGFPIGDERVLCLPFQSYNMILYDVNRVLATSGASGVTNLNNSLALTNKAGGGQLVVDPVNRLAYYIGTYYEGNNSYIYSVMLDSPHTQSTIMAYQDGNTTVGTGATDLTGGSCRDWASFAGPGAQWDPTINKIVGYVPRGTTTATGSLATTGATSMTVANVAGLGIEPGDVVFGSYLGGGANNNYSVTSVSGSTVNFTPAAGNTGSVSSLYVTFARSASSTPAPATNEIFVFDPNTNTCTLQADSVTSGPSAQNMNTSEGIWNDFSYVPNLNLYAVWVNSSGNAWTYKLSPGTPAVPAVNPTFLPAGTASQPYSQTLTASNFLAGTLTWSVTSGSLPPGLTGCSASSSSPTNVISGTLTTAGTYSFTCRVSDGTNSVSNPYTVVVNSGTSATPASVVSSGATIAHDPLKNNN